MKRLLVAALALACALPCLAFAATLTATPATAWNVVKAAGPGDIVQLTPGDYASLNLWGIAKAAPGVTVQPAPGAGVTLSAINADQSSFLTFTGFDVTMTPATQYGLEAAGAGTSNIVFDGIKVHQADASNLVGVGFFIRNASNVVVRNSEVYWTGTGGGVVDSDQVLITGNLIHDINVDGILLSGATNATVTKNALHDFHPGDGDHPDAIQFFNTADHPVSGPIEIAFNHVERGSVGQLQGIFGEGGAGISIHDNELLGTMTNGIALAGTKGASIDHNFLAGYPDMGTGITVRGGCDQVKITNNAAQAVVNYAPAGEAACTNVAIAGNSQIQAVQPGDLSALNAWKGTAATLVVTPPVVSPPVVTSPAVNPLQATVDSLNAKVASLTSQLAAAAKLAQTVQTAVTAVQRPLTDLKAALK